jgi:hypothetical protein
LAIEYVVGDGAAHALILGQAPAPGPGTQALQAHQPLNSVQPAVLILGQHVVPHAACAIGAVAADEALTHLGAQHFVGLAAATRRPYQPRVEATARDTERLAQQVHWPRPSVLRNELELHSESLAK